VLGGALIDLPFRQASSDECRILECGCYILRVAIRVCAAPLDEWMTEKALE